jgi:CO dehydrogenase nickel-insertion accessory protein CooC1
MKNKFNDIERGTITSESPQVVNLVLQRKGEVGKSLVACIFAQFYRANRHAAKCIDTDPVNPTFSQYAGIGAQHLKLMDGNQVVPRRFDDLIEEILASDESFVIDSGSATFIPLWHYMIE